MKYRRTDNRMDIETGKTYAGREISCFLDDYLISRSRRYSMLQEQVILCSGVPVKSPSQILKEDDVLTIYWKEDGPEWPAAESPCRVMYENEFVYIVHKDPHLIIHGSEDDTHCLNAMAAKYQLDHGIMTPVRPIHRLDQDTTGLVLYSKIPFFQPWFDHQLEEKKIARHYLAVCTGRNVRPKQKFFSDRRIGRDRHHAGMYRVSSTGKPARTSFECIAEKDGFMLISCMLDTGRTHQIRVHLSSMGLPIVNDPLYGHPSHQFKEMGLWADSITFRDPLTRKKHTIRDLPNPDYDFFRDSL